MDDYIKRKDAINVLTGRAHDIRAFIEKCEMDAEEASRYWCEVHGVYSAIELIESLPSTDVRENVKGKWLCSDDMYEMAVCSICKHDTHEPVDYARANYHFCSNCGADNRGDTDD